MADTCSLRTALVVAAAAMCFVRSASSAETVWNHNGSTVVWISDGNKRVAKYLDVRSDLVGAGVSTGTVLFTGEREDKMITGTAFIFRKGCSPVAYQVAGLAISETVIELKGIPPLRDGCRTVGENLASRHTVLRFEYLRSAP